MSGRNARSAPRRSRAGWLATLVGLSLLAIPGFGVGLLAGKSFFPSAYVGSQVNKFGRVQAVSGAGVWWNKIGTYVTVFHALNGLDSPFIPADDARFQQRFAYIQNGGLNLSLSYEIANFEFLVSRGYAFKNGGDDIVFEVRYRFFFNADDL